MSPIIARGKRDFRPAPEGLHQAVLVDVIDLGEQPTPWGPAPKVEMRWQIKAINPDNNKRFQVRARYRLSLHEKAKLRQHLEGVRGKKFTLKDAHKGFDLEQLIGVNAQLHIVHNLGKDGGTYANIQNIVPLEKGVPLLKPLDYTRGQDQTGNGAAALEEADDTDSDDEDHDDHRDQNHHGGQEDLGF